MWNSGATATKLDFNNFFFVLPNDIYAMQIIPQAEREHMLSPGHWLPKGARIQACGKGFDSETVRVCYGGQHYFVFLSDLG